MHSGIPAQQNNQTNPRIIPLLRVPSRLPSLRCYGPLDPGRQRLEHMVRKTFARSYGARLHSSLPRDLLGFESGGKLLGVAGLRPAAAGRLFSEQYLDEPVEQVIASITGIPVCREHIIEVGSLALDGRGEARWLIAAVTAYLHDAGFQWVLFTAVSPLYNAFHRMGLEPQRLAPAEAHRLNDAGQDWGSYYDQSPQVCFGSIRAGHRHLEAVINTRQSRLWALWERARAAGRAYRQGNNPGAVKQA